jgi:hypothetical protein
MDKRHPLPRQPKMQPHNHQKKKIEVQAMDIIFKVLTGETKRYIINTKFQKTNWNQEVVTNL